MYARDDEVRTEIACGKVERISPKWIFPALCRWFMALVEASTRHKRRQYKGDSVAFTLVFMCTFVEGVLTHYFTASL